MILSPQVKLALDDLFVSFIRGLKVFLVYILPSMIVALLLSEEFRSYVESNPKLAAIAPIVNVVAVMGATMIKQRIPEDSPVSRLL